MAKKTYDEIVQSERDLIRTTNPSVNTEEGSIVRDLFINPPANEIQNIYNENERIKLIHSLFYQTYMTNDELDMLGFNWGIVRKEAQVSSGTVILYRSAVFTQDIIVPAGSVFSTQKDTSFNSTSFTSSVSVTMYVALIATYYNSVTGYYEISVPVSAIVAGVSGNVGVNTIKVLTSGVSGFLGVRNDAAFTDGEDQESNTLYANRILDALAGNNVGTEFGYKKAVTSLSTVDDAVVITPGDALMIRDNGLGGKIDIYVKTDLTSSDVFKEAIDSFVFNDASGGIGANDPLNDHTIINRPVKSVTSVTSSLYGTLVPGVDYNFVPDTTTVYARSDRSQDKIHFLKTNVPAFGETVTVDYYYYNIIEDVNNVLDTERQKIVTADVLVLLAQQIDINVNCTVYADDTITDAVAFRDLVITALQESINSDLLANKIEQSDLVKQIYTVTGVDRVDVPFITLNAPSDPNYTGGPYNLIQLAGNQFSWSGTITVTVVLAS
jgi:uncharacterized phage protein gp47/JayE